MTYFGHFYVKLGPNLKRLFRCLSFWAINIGPKQLAGKGQEVNRRKLPPIGLTPFELAPTLMNKMGVVQNFYDPKWG